MKPEKIETEKRKHQPIRFRWSEACLARPKLSEDPREWRKFSVAAIMALGIVVYLLQRRGLAPGRPIWILAVAFGALVPVLLRPVLFRSFYRAGATFGFYMGQVIATVALAVCFISLVVPIGLLLRVLNKDLLNLRRNPNQSSYWRDAEKTHDLNQQF